MLTTNSKQINFWKEIWSFFTENGWKSEKKIDQKEEGRAWIRGRGNSSWFNRCESESKRTRTDERHNDSVISNKKTDVSNETPKNASLKEIKRKLALDFPGDNNNATPSEKENEFSEGKDGLSEETETIFGIPDEAQNKTVISKGISEKEFDGIKLQVREEEDEFESEIEEVENASSESESEPTSQAESRSIDSSETSSSESSESDESRLESDESESDEEPLKQRVYQERHKTRYKDKKH